MSKSLIPLSMVDRMCKNCLTWLNNDSVEIIYNTPLLLNSYMEDNLVWAGNGSDKFFVGSCYQ